MTVAHLKRLLRAQPRNGLSFGPALLCIVSAVVWQLLWCSPSGAYVLEGQKWADSRATFYVNPADGPGTAVTSITNAMDTWTATTSAGFSFIYGGTTTSHAFGTNDGTNNVDFGSLSASNWGYALYWYDENNNLLDADVRINVDKPWGTSSLYDVETVALHELGHAIGLGHTSDTSSVMYPVVTDIMHDLTQDDISALAALYPGTSVQPRITTADFNNDGRDDIAYVSAAGSVFYTTDLGSNWSQVSGYSFSALATGEFDGTAGAELAGINLNGYLFYTQDFSTWIRIGENKFASVAGGDLDSDGSADELAAINLNQYVLYSADLSTWTKVGENKFSSINIGDYDASGAENDIAGINLNGYILYTTDSSTWTKIGENKFSSMVTGDFDGDGTNDNIAGINLNQYILYSNDLSVWQKIGSNKFSDFAAGDFDSDGLTDDLAAVNLNQYILYTTDLSAWTKIGSYKFSALNAGDFDGDGRNDDIAGINLNGHILYTTDLSTWTKITKPE